MKLWIPLKCPSMNKFFGRGHWTKRKAIVDEWNETVWLVCRENKIKPLYRKVYPISIITQSFFLKAPRRDTSNCFTSNKLIEDGLVKCGIIPEDHTEYVKEHRVLCPQFNAGREGVEVQILMKGEVENECAE